MIFRSRIDSDRHTRWRRARWPIAFFAGAFALAAVGEPVPDTCRIHYPSDAAIKWTCHRIGRHDSLTGLFGSDWQDVLRFNRIDQRHIYPGVRIKVPEDLRQVEDFTPMPQRYPPADSDPKFILVNLTEQFLGAYADGRLLMSFPIASGANDPPSRRTPDGSFKVTAYDRLHSSSLYDLPDNSTPYPMHYALRFFINSDWRAFWLHGRDMPGYAASHGCIGLYDEQMQKKYYGHPRKPVMEDARRLYEWAIAPHPDDGHFHELRDGPPVLIIGRAPDFPPRPTAGKQASPAARCRPGAGCLACGAPAPGPGTQSRSLPPVSPRQASGLRPPSAGARSDARARY